MKYSTLGELRAAYRTDALSPDCVLMLDNDSSDVYDVRSDEDVFTMHPAELLTQALELLGIPHAHV